MPSRRNLLIYGVGAMAALTLQLRLARVAHAATVTNKRMIIVILRGAMDGLSAVPPYGDRDYSRLRGDIAIGAPGAANGAINLDGFFGLHPALPFLGERFQADEMAVIHAAATPYRSRSHFDGQDVLENGAKTPMGALDGWLNRALTLFSGSGQALAIAQTPSLILRGMAPVGSWAPDVLPPTQDDLMTRLAMLYDEDTLLGPALQEGMRIQTMSGATMGDGATDNKIKNAASDNLAAMATPVGRMLADPFGPRIAVFEMTGWDTHYNQGNFKGKLSNSLKALDMGLSSLHASLGSAWADTAVIVATEFGRTAAVNGARGTDHGTASAAFVLGGAISGGRVLGSWPGLAKNKLYEGRDLMPTSDLRALFSAALIGHLGLDAVDVSTRVFPGGPSAGKFAELFQG
jgi:uncharacterized protein (DUF1501 family)